MTINQTFKTGRRAVVTSTPIYDREDRICMVVTNVRDISELPANDGQNYKKIMNII